MYIKNFMHFYSKGTPKQPSFHFQCSKGIAILSLHLVPPTNLQLPKFSRRPIKRAGEDVSMKSELCIQDYDNGNALFNATLNTV